VVNPDDLHREIQESLLASANAVYRQGALRYFNPRDRNEVELYGVRSTEVRKIVAAAWRKWKEWPESHRNELCEALWKSGKLEEGAVAIYLCRKVCRGYGAREFARLGRWLDSYVSNWAHCDGVSSWLAAACIANEPALIDELGTWACSPNRWKRRAAAVSLLQEAKQGRHPDRILEIADLLLDDNDTMVQKGVGWLLKETYPKQPKAVVAFLRANKRRAARLLLRYAAGKMTRADRRRVLS